jgi:hypothetical protein
VPGNVKEMVDRFEVLRRLEADHAARFGYKDFLPIQEQEKKQAPSSSAGGMFTLVSQI